MNKNVLKLKFIIIGDSSVGKTCLLIRYISEQFSENCKATIGIDSQIKSFEYKGFKINLHIFDSAGQEKYRAIIKNYLI